MFKSLFPSYSQKIFLPPKQKIEISYYSKLLNKIYNIRAPHNSQCNSIIKIVPITSKKLKIFDVINNLEVSPNSVSISQANKINFFEDYNHEDKCK